MSTLADYIVLRDTNITLSKDEETSPPFKFTLPSNFVVGTGDARTVLAYKINPSGGSNKHYEIDLNDTVVLSSTTSEEAARVLWEVINGDLYRAGQENTIQIRFEQGSGSIDFSDVVLWYQREIAV